MRSRYAWAPLGAGALVLACSNSRDNGQELASTAASLTSAACTSTTYEAESISHTTGGAATNGWNIWSNGAIYSTHNFVGGKTTITVTASGQSAAGAWPNMVVSVGGTTIGQVSVASSTSAQYAFTFNATAGAQEVRVAFDNDYYSDSEDRNLIVDKVVVGCPDSNASPLNASITVTSSWNNGYCANVVVQNPTSAPVSGWTVTVDTHQSSVYQNWNSALTGTGPQYTLTPSAGYDTIPAAGKTESVGFCANTSGTDWTPTIVAINGSNSAPPPPPPPPPTTTTPPPTTPPPSTGGVDWLRTEGNRILHADGKRFHGRGMNVFDTRECGVCSWAAPQVKEVLRRIDEAVDVWHANFLRLDLTSYASNVSNGATLAQWGNVLKDSAYLADLQTIVAHIGSKPGVFVEVALWVDPTTDANELPTAATQQVWQKLAQTFRDSHHVLYGITNEPHGATDAAVWNAMNTTVATIRATEAAQGPHHIILVQGTQSWARDVRYYISHPITAGGGVNIAYETHVYNPQSDFSWMFVEPSKQLPLIIGEFGPASMSNADCDALMNQAEQLEVPYIGWAFAVSCGPDMLQSQGDSCGSGMPLVPSAWGTQLKNRLAKPW